MTTKKALRQVWRHVKLNWIIYVIFVVVLLVAITGYYIFMKTYAVPEDNGTGNITWPSITWPSNPIFPDLVIAQNSDSVLN